MSKQTKSLLCFFLGISFCCSLTAQLDEDEWYYGFSAGITRSSIDDVQTTLIRPIFPQETYSTQINEILGFTAGASVFFRFRNSKFAIQPEINFSSQGGNFSYEDIDGLQYDLDFKYTYVQLSPMVKFYMAHGLYASFGPQLSLIVDRSKLTYVSNQPDLGPDLQIQQSLREVLKGNSNVGLIMSVGYETPFGLGLNYKYIVGISDAVETLANGFYFIENTNTSKSMHLTLSYHIPFYN